MIQKASYVGELAVRVLSHGGEGEVTRAFPSSAYVRAGQDFLLLLWGGLRSPMTLNILQDRGTRVLFRTGESCSLGATGVSSESATIAVKGAELYRGSLRSRRPVVLPAEKELAKGTTMLKSLYDVSPPAPRLVSDGVFRAFVARTLSPFAAGRSEVIYRLRNYLGLIGRGGGFTPAGDDFVSGFVGAFNYFALCRRSRRITIPRGSVMGRTVPESGAMVEYSSMGYLDEGLERLILKSSSRGGAGFFDELLAVASRGHTSGIDMSLGVLLCEAAVSDSETGGGALKGCLRVLWDR